MRAIIFPCLISLIILALNPGLWVDDLRAHYAKRKPVKEVLQHIELEPSIYELITQVSREQGVSAKVLEVIIRKESNFDTSQVYRFEPSVYLRYSHKREGRMLASSHGLTHVMGFNAQPLCGVHWSKLYDHKTAITCAAKIFKSNLKQAQKISDDPKNCLAIALRRYNGSGAAAEKYARDAIALLDKINDSNNS